MYEVSNPHDAAARNHVSKPSKRTPCHRHPRSWVKKKVLFFLTKTRKCPHCELESFANADDPDAQPPPCEPGFGGFRLPEPIRGTTHEQAGQRHEQTSRTVEASGCTPRPLHPPSTYTPAAVASSRKDAAPVASENVTGGGDLSHATPRVRSPASSRGEIEKFFSEAAADGSSPLPVMSDGYSPQTPVANGAGASKYLCAPPSSSAVSATSTEDDGLRGIEALCAFLSAAGAGAGAGASGVKMDQKVENGTPVRLTPRAKLSVTSPNKRADTEPSQGAVVYSDSETDNESQEAVVFSDSETNNGQALSVGSQSSEASTKLEGTGCVPPEGAASSRLSHEGFPAVWNKFQADAAEWRSMHNIDKNDDPEGSQDKKDGGPPHEDEKTPGQAAVAGNRMVKEPSKPSWFGRVRGILARAPLWARNQASARPERVRVQMPSHVCMRTQRARVWEERAQERRSQGLSGRVGPVHEGIHGNTRYF